MIYWNVCYRCKNGVRAEFYQALCSQKIREKTLGEAGCVRYDFFFDAQDPDVLLLVEIWTDHESQNTHRQTKTCHQLQVLKAEYCVDTVIDKFKA